MTVMQKIISNAKETLSDTAIIKIRYQLTGSEAELWADETPALIFRSGDLQVAWNMDSTGEVYISCALILNKNRTKLTLEQKEKLFQVISNGTVQPAEYKIRQQILDELSACTQVAAEDFNLKVS